MKVTMCHLLQYYKLICLTVLLGHSVHGVFQQSTFFVPSFQCSLSTKENSTATFPSISASSVTECTLRCYSEPFCKYFTYNNGVCQIYHVQKDVVTARKGPNEDFYFSLDDDMTWHRIYSIKAGSNIDVFNAYNDRSIINKPSLKYSQASCKDLFRSALIDTWETLPIEEVKLVFHNGTNDLLTLRFNGTGSTKTDWFVMDRVLSSPWTDFGKGKPNRLVTMRYSRLRVCHSYAAWTTIVQAHRWCKFSKQAQYPTFIFAKGSTATNWEKKGYGTAERMSIYIRLA